MKRRKLKRSVKRRIDGIIMIFIAILCVITEADGAAMIIGFYGFACLFSTVKRRRHSIIYHIAKAIVAHEEHERDRKSA